MTANVIDSRVHRVQVLRDAAAVSAVLADEVLAFITEHPAATLGVATGSSPAGAYAELARRAPAGAFSEVRAFALDEYVELPARHPRSYYSELLREFAEPLGIPADRLQTPDPSRPAAYDDAIRDAGGIDMQILGIGRNGHVAFNEPGAAVESTTRVVTLSQQTRDDNSRFFAGPEDVPRHAVTQGMATILRARRLIVVAVGEHKAAAVRAALHGPIDKAVPASLLRLHPHVDVLVDESLWRVASGAG